MRSSVPFAISPTRATWPTARTQPTLTSSATHGPSRRMNRQPTVSVVVPVYNEIELVEASVRAIDRFLGGQELDYEIIVIESGSTDGSAAACDRLAERLRAVPGCHGTPLNGCGS